VPSFRVADEVFAKLPGLRVVSVVARGISDGDRAAVDAEWTAAWAAVHDGFGYENAQSHPRIAQWRLAMRGVGAPHKEFPTSVESLVRRAIKGPAPFRVHPVVDFYNAVSLRHVVPAGAFDLAALDSDLELRLTRDGDSFSALDAEADEAVPPGEVAYATGSTILTRHLVWRQSRLAAIGSGTRGALFVSELLGGHEELAPSIESALVEGLRGHFHASVSAAVVSAERPMLTLADPS
jgi:DNA/RNA-binding domain of Phe-tRNA-synthetase-like protein